MVSWGAGGMATPCQPTHGSWLMHTGDLALQPRRAFAEAAHTQGSSCADLSPRVLGAHRSPASWSFLELGSIRLFNV